MCGIVGAVAERDVVPILLEGLRRLEYRGYDSAGIAVIDHDTHVARVRALGKVEALVPALQANYLRGATGIAHTRWATHGKPSEANAHPHVCNNTVALVHNGIIENHQILKTQQLEQGFKFTSETDTEVIVHEVYQQLNTSHDLLTAVRQAVDKLEGAFALGVICNTDAERLVATRRGSPLVIGIGIGEHFIASDVAALLPVTNRFIFLEEGDIADIRRGHIIIYDRKGEVVERPIKYSSLTADSADKGTYRHYMLKEIFEQPRAISDTLQGRLTDTGIAEDAFGFGSNEVLSKIDGIHILACGTSYHAGLIAKYWFESIARIPCSVEIASEFRYRKPVVRNNNLIITISQSGETADTLAALEEAKRLGFGHSLTVCNVLESSLTRCSDLALMTRAGPEIGVASTKAFTTQLAALLLLVVAVGRQRGLAEQDQREIVTELLHLPTKIEQILGYVEEPIKHLSETFTDKHHALFLGRGAMYPVAMEGALKLKEISYIHAEAYPAGELKHGPLALVDEKMPVITVAPNNDLLEKLKSNMQEVYARGGQLIVFADPAANIEASDGTVVIPVVSAKDVIAPILYTIPLQLLSYYVAVLKGTDVDQPRNLAKSVTVE